jgi:hypothetical protein
MAKALHVYVLPAGGGPVAVEHVFYGHTEDECDAVFDAHAAGCEFLGPAIEEDRIFEEIEEIEEADWPTTASLAEEEEEEDSDSATDESELDT